LNLQPLHIPKHSNLFLRNLTAKTPYYRLREHRSGEVLWQRARESHTEIPPKVIHHYPAGMGMKTEGDIEEIEFTGFIKMILMASTAWHLSESTTLSQRTTAARPRTTPSYFPRHGMKANSSSRAGCGNAYTTGRNLHAKTIFLRDEEGSAIISST
jgi:hypothetical protein